MESASILDGTTDILQDFVIQWAAGSIVSFLGDVRGSIRRRRDYLGEVKLQLTPVDVQHLLDLYVAGIRQTDTNVGRLIEYLRDRNLLDDTLVVLVSDHGEEFLEHGSVLHGRTQYQEIMHVPLILRGPGVPKGVRVGTPVSIVDVLPTLLSLLASRAPLPPLPSVIWSGF